MRTPDAPPSEWAPGRVVAVVGRGTLTATTAGRAFRIASQARASSAFNSATSDGAEVGRSTVDSAAQRQAPRTARTVRIVVQAFATVGRSILVPLQVFPRGGGQVAAEPRHVGHGSGRALAGLWYTGRPSLFETARRRPDAARP